MSWAGVKHSFIQWNQSHQMSSIRSESCFTQWCFGHVTAPVPVRLLITSMHVIWLGPVCFDQWELSYSRVFLCSSSLFCRAVRECFLCFGGNCFQKKEWWKKTKTSAVIRLVVKGWVCFTDCHWHWSSVKYQRSRFHYCSGLDLVWNAQHVVRLQTRESKYDLNVLRFLNNSWSRFSFYMNSCCRSKSRDVRRWYVMSAFS